MKGLRRPPPLVVDSLLGIVVAALTWATARLERERALDAQRAAAEERVRIADPQLAPQPDLGDLEALVESVRRSGLPVDLSVHGDARPLAPGLELSAYRIVHEALTTCSSTRRPGMPRSYGATGPDDVTIRVTDDGRGDSAPNGHGRGLVGMRERVAMFGGEIVPRPEGGFAVQATLPHGGR